MPATRWTAAENKLKYALTDPTNAGTTSNQAGPNGTDIAQSIDIGAVRANSSVWLFGDTWWLTAAGMVRSQLTHIRNVIGLQTGRDLSTATYKAYTLGTDSVPLDYFPTGSTRGAGSVDGTVAWRYPFGGVLLDDRLLVVGAWCIGTPVGAGGNLNTSMVGSWAALIGDMGNANPRLWERLDLDVQMGALPYYKAPAYYFGCNPIDFGDGWVYFYCFGPQASNRWAVCRADRNEVKAGNLRNLKWWDGGSRWLADSVNPDGSVRRFRVNVLSESVAGNDQAGGVAKRADGSLVFTYVVDGGWRNAVDSTGTSTFPYVVKQSARANPAGRFPVGSQIISATQEVTNQDFIYSAYELPEQTWSGKGASDHFVTVGYNNTSPGIVFGNSLSYWPRFYQVTP